MIKTHLVECLRRLSWRFSVAADRLRGHPADTTTAWKILSLKPRLYQRYVAAEAELDKVLWETAQNSGHPRNQPPHWGRRRPKVTWEYLDTGEPCRAAPKGSPT